MRVLIAMFIVAVTLVGVAHAAYLTGDPCVGKATLAADQEVVYSARLAGPAAGSVPAALVACPERVFGWQDRQHHDPSAPEAASASGSGSGSGAGD